MAKYSLGSEPVVGSLTPSRKREYRVTNRLQEGKRPLYAVVFNFIDSRYFNVFATVGGNRVSASHVVLFLWNMQGKDCAALNGKFGSDPCFIFEVFDEFRLVLRSW